MAIRLEEYVKKQEEEIKKELQKYKEKGGKRAEMAESAISAIESKDVARITKELRENFLFQTVMEDFGFPVVEYVLKTILHHPEIPIASINLSYSVGIGGESSSAFKIEIKEPFEVNAEGNGFRRFQSAYKTFRKQVDLVEAIFYSIRELGWIKGGPYSINELLERKIKEKDKEIVERGGECDDLNRGLFFFITEGRTLLGESEKYDYFPFFISFESSEPFGEYQGHSGVVVCFPRENGWGVVYFDPSKIDNEPIDLGVLNEITEKDIKSILEIKKYSLLPNEFKEKRIEMFVFSFSNAVRGNYYSEFGILAAKNEQYDVSIVNFQLALACGYSTFITWYNLTGVFTKLCLENPDMIEVMEEIFSNHKPHVDDYTHLNIALSYLNAARITQDLSRSLDLYKKANDWMPSKAPVKQEFIFYWAAGTIDLFKAIESYNSIEYDAAMKKARESFDHAKKTLESCRSVEDKNAALDLCRDAAQVFMYAAKKLDYSNPEELINLYQQITAPQER